jgi:hypothetical protein
MAPNADMLELARSVLVRNRTEKRDTAWDSRGTPPETVSQSIASAGTTKSAENQADVASVPLSHALGSGTVGHPENAGTPLGTVAGQSPYSVTLAALKARCPTAIDTVRWQQAIQDADSFIAKWGAQARAFGWTTRELFGLHPVPPRPAPTHQRLARYDATGLIWLLQGCPVVALTESEAAIQRSGAVVMYRKHRKPALGPLGDSLDDMGACR